MDDKMIRDNILAELDYEPSLDAAHIGVTVEDGVVTLTGHVSSYAERLAAEAATRRIKGVRAIAQDIAVRLPENKKTADDEIAKRVLSILRWNVQVPDNTIQVTVRDGWVTLAGAVDWQYQRAAAEHAVRKLSGVTGVLNSIVVSAHVQVPDVQRNIEAALKRCAEVEAKGIRVAVKDGTVTLDGTVDNWEERAAVERAAWASPGVLSVQDHVRIR